MTNANSQTKAVIFDLDGTLIDSAPDIAAAVNLYLTDVGYDAQDTDFVEKFIGYGPRKLLVDIFNHLGHPTGDATVAAAHATYLENYRQTPAKNTRFYPNVREDLKALAENDFRLGICTNKPDELTGRVLEALGIAGLFEATIGADAVPKCKPDPGHLIAVAEEMSLPNGSWVYVGDTPIDQNTAEAAQVPFYAVPWGGGSQLNIAKDKRLSRLSDLLAVRELSKPEVQI